MRRNRVDPLGALHAVAPRGAWMGNRGCLHDAEGTIRRAHATRRWITCRTAFRGRSRPVMQPGRYTELFFLDEATAYAAGHRPCAECRHADWLRFRALWSELFGDPTADAIDTRLHATRLDGQARRLVPTPAQAVPDGAMILHDGAPLLRWGGWWRWGFTGYTRCQDPRLDSGPVALLTPEPLARLMAAGLPVQVAK